VKFLQTYIAIQMGIFERLQAFSFDMKFQGTGYFTVFRIVENHVRFERQ